MVNFILVIDPDDRRRLKFVDLIREMIMPVEGLTVTSLSNENCTVVWAAGNWTPTSMISDQKGMAMIFGDALRDTEPEQMTATDLRKLWNDSRIPPALDGFHIAFTYNPEKELTFGADLLGLFPVYYYFSDEVLLVGSSTRLFHFHPLFKTSLNPEGLVGIFLTKCLLNGQTILSGVKRLGAGCLLKYDGKKEPKEFRQFKVPVSTQFFDLKLTEQIEVIDQVFKEAISRHVPKNRKHCLMLSGGLDSTLIAGYIRNNGVDVITVTEGIPSDNEMKCATQMAKALDFKHLGFDVGYRDYVRFADLSITWQEVIDGFIGIPTWGFYQHLRKTAPRLVAGFLGDGIFGSIIGWAISKAGEPVSFDSYLNRLSVWAFKPGKLRRILKDENAKNLIEEVLQKARNVFESYDGEDFQKVWIYSLNHIHRFHDGAGLWTLALGSWPVLPFVDQKILMTLGGMPLEVLKDRRLEMELFKNKFPALAKLQLSGGDFGAKYLVPSFSQKIMHQISGNDGIWRNGALYDLRSVLLLALKGERRYWPRTATGFYTAGWKDVRRKAELDLRNSLPLMDSEAIREIMPSPSSSFLGVQWRIKRAGIPRTSSLKLLMQLAMWSSKNREMIEEFSAA